MIPRSVHSVARRGAKAKIAWCHWEREVVSQHLARFATLLLLLAWPASVSAAPPPSVQTVSATYEEEAVRVRWVAPDDAGIVRYRIYFSHKSILENGGQYDDFESTPGDVTEFLFTDLPPIATLYVSVLAVNAAGEESRTFGTEASVALPRQTMESGTAAEPLIVPTEGESLRLLTAQALTESSVSLVFSESVTVREEEGAGAFELYSSGGALPISSITIDGDMVTLATAPMQQGILYVAKALLVRAATTSPDEPTKIMDPTANAVSFTYIASAATPPPAQTIDLPAPTNARFSIERMQGGMADVLLSFDVPGDASGISSFEVYQSADGGRNFGAPQQLPATARGVRFTNVPRGTLVALLRSRAADGRTSASVPATITVGTGSAQQPRVPLADSGPGIATILAMTGAIVGWRRARKNGKLEMRNAK